MPVRTDEWGIDAIYSGTQKCLSAPPGLSPVSLSARAHEMATQRNTKVQSWYLDMTMIMNYWGGNRAYHHTPPITSVGAERGLANWPAMRPTLITGTLAP